ncbi:GntR family transcriptional regulator [Roseomonas chloroacetimidivorans]|jgi:DNA-binding GntR family transcriptional regulator|uniref:GntR family transcriptional regulator n=1 Tax=Roseomonas chloroacetimidivorans TaxID=1766656 RepID=UPI003C731AB4
MPSDQPKPSRSSGSEAYDLLLQAIESGALPAGTRLREAELAERFRISRTPVREALKRLEAQGLVLHEPHHGAVVASLDYGQMTELYHMREVLEGTAAGLAATHATVTEVEILREMVERDRGLLDDPQALAATNRAFHRQVRLSARNRFLNATLENMRISLALLAGTTLAVPNRGAESVEEHEAIVAAIERRDAAAAEASARQHIRNAFKARIGLEHRER